MSAWLPDRESMIAEFIRVCGRKTVLVNEGRVFVEIPMARALKRASDGDLRSALLAIRTQAHVVARAVALLDSHQFCWWRLSNQPQPIDRFLKLASENTFFSELDEGALEQGAEQHRDEPSPVGVAKNNPGGEAKNGLAGRANVDRSIFGKSGEARHDDPSLLAEILAELRTISAILSSPQQAAA